MITLSIPPGAKEVKPRCPDCGRTGAIHARFVRAVHDWQVTFHECLRVRCCGKTFTLAPAGLSLHARYSDRTIRVARILFASGISLRQVAKTLGRIGVPVSAQTIHQWCRHLQPSATASAWVTTQPDGGINVRLRPDLFLNFKSRYYDQLLMILAEHGAQAEESR